MNVPRKVNWLGAGMFRGLVSQRVLDLGSKVWLGQMGELLQTRRAVLPSWNVDFQGGGC